MERLRKQKARNQSWFWARIAVACWTLLVQAMAMVVFFFGSLSGLKEAPATGEYLFAVFLSLVFALPPVGILAGPAWAALAIARRQQHIGGAILAVEGLFLSIPIGCLWIGTANNIVAKGGFDSTDKLYCGTCGSLSVLFSTPPLVAGLLLLASWWRSAREELTDFAPMPRRFPDFSPMPETFADYERMLEDTKEKTGTLVCYECGYYNSVGQANCEDCGAWVPQTAKARWTYGADSEP